MLFIAILFAMQSYSQYLPEERFLYNFVVWLYDGSKISFPLEAHPLVTYYDGTIVVSSDEGLVKYPQAQIRKFTIEKVVNYPDHPLDTPFYFIVWFHDSTRISFPLAEHPLLTYFGGNIVVTTSKEQLSYAHTSVRKFTLADESSLPNGDITEISVSEQENLWNLQGNVMYFSNCTPKENVAIYDLIGQIVARYAVSSDGTLQIPLQQLSEGTYIVKTQSITYKFKKK